VKKILIARLVSDLEKAYLLFDDKSGRSEQRLSLSEKTQGKVDFS